MDRSTTDSDAQFNSAPVVSGSLEAATVTAGVEAGDALEYIEPRYLADEELTATVKPTDAQLALCCLYANR